MKKNEETLAEYLERQAKKKKIKIGSQDGSCFFYCGTCGDILENMSKYTRWDNAYLAKRLKNANDGLENALKTDVSPAGFLRKKVFDAKAKKLNWLAITEEDYKEYVRRHLEIFKADLKRSQRSRR